jgi:hypothetical protein
MSKEKKDKKPLVNPELEGFEFRVNSLGEISSTFDIEKINDFLNKNVDDKKLKERKNTESDS